MVHVRHHYASILLRELGLPWCESMKLGRLTGPLLFLGRAPESVAAAHLHSKTAFQSITNDAALSVNALHAFDRYGQARQTWKQ